MVGAAVAGDHDGAHRGAPPGDDVAVEGVAHVPGLGGLHAERLGGQVDHARVRFADAHLVGVDLHPEGVPEAEVVEDRAVRAAGVGVGDDAQADAPCGALGEQLGDAGAEVMVGDQGRHRREQLRGVQGEALARRRRQIREQEVLDDLARAQLARGEAAAGGVLPQRQGGASGAQRFLDRGEVQLCPEGPGAVHHDLGELPGPAHAGRGRDDHPAEVQQQGARRGQGRRGVLRRRGGGGRHEPGPGEGVGRKGAARRSGHVSPIRKRGGRGLVPASHLPR